MNLPTHGHGQGYTDVNFLIPELVANLRYRKGPYSVQQGDFASAGAAHVDYVRTPDAGFGEIGLGENGFRRALAATAPRVGSGNLLLAGSCIATTGRRTSRSGIARTTPSCITRRAWSRTVSTSRCWLTTRAGTRLIRWRAAR
ncbi:MAG TPA: hypothetical protein VFR86_23410 [Burkholderiaceae bacterium]|nr:hypothetical protein [Burkholderiaceae bacterium]